MALVLVDGEAASIKALEMCCVPGVVVKEQDKEQLVAVHVWRDHIITDGDEGADAHNTTLGAGGPPTTASGGAKPPAAGGGVNSSTIGAGGGSGAAGAANAAAGGAAGQTAAVNPLAVMQNVMAVTSTINYVLGNRYAQSGLNYKIETMRLQAPGPNEIGGQPPMGPNSPAAAAAAAGAAANNSRPPTMPPIGSSGAKKNSIAPSAQQQQQAEAAAAATAAAAAAANTTNTPPPPTPTELGQLRLAQEVSAYAYLRAKHHHRGIIMFGVGNKVNEKKQHILGTSAKAMLDLVYKGNDCGISSDFIGGSPLISSSSDAAANSTNTNNYTGLLNLTGTSKAVARIPQPKLHYYAIKSTGATIRPTTTIKYLIMLQLQYSFAEGDEATSSVNEEGTTIVHVPTPIGCTLTPASLAALAVLKQYARQGTQDDVGALIIANDGIPMYVAPPPVEYAADGVTPIVPKKPKSYVPPKLITKSDTTVEHLDDLIRPISNFFLEWTIENGLEKKSDEDDNKNGATASGGEQSGTESGGSPASPAPTTSAAPPAATGGVAMLLPLLSKVYLETSRDVPYYPVTGDNAPQQFAKAVNTIKPDVLIVPNGTSRAVVEAILALPKPHVLLCSE